MAGLGDRIIDEASHHLHGVSDHPADLVGGKRKGWELLKQVLTEAPERPIAWTAANLKAIQTPAMWLRRDGQGGTTDAKVAIHWCGIFAAYILRRVGMEVRWRWGVGIEPSNIYSPYVRKYTKYRTLPKFDPSMVRAGWVVAIPRGVHHLIVVEAKGDTLYCIAGNGRYQRIERQETTRRDIDQYYELVL